MLFNEHLFVCVSLQNLPICARASEPPVANLIPASTPVMELLQALPLLWQPASVLTLCCRPLTSHSSHKDRPGARNPLLAASVGSDLRIQAAIFFPTASRSGADSFLAAFSMFDILSFPQVSFELVFHSIVAHCRQLVSRCCACTQVACS